MSLQWILRAVPRTNYDWGNVHEEIMTEAICMSKFSSAVFSVIMMI